MLTLLIFFVESFLWSAEDLKELEIPPVGKFWLPDCESSVLGEPVNLLSPLLNDVSCFKTQPTVIIVSNNSCSPITYKMLFFSVWKIFVIIKPKIVLGFSWDSESIWRQELTGALLCRVLMPCLLFTSSSTFTGLNIKEAFPDLEAGGRHPCLFSYVRQVVQSRELSLPTWCQSLEAVQ